MLIPGRYGAVNARLWIKNKGAVYCTLAVVVCVIINVVLTYAVNKAGLPLYLDTIGTIFVTALAGVVPGLFTAVATNVVCSLFNENALYYSIINVLIALLTAWFTRQGKFRRKRDILFYLAAVSVVSGVLGMVIQLLLLGEPQFADVAETAKILSGSAAGAGYFAAAAAVNVGLNLIDKAISAGAAFTVLRFVKDEDRKLIRNSVWRQRPLSDEEAQKAVNLRGKRSLLRKMSIMITVIAVSFVAIMSWVSIGVYFDNVKMDYARNAENCARLVSEVVDGDSLEKYLKDGTDSEGYDDIKDLLYSIRDASNGVKYLYIVKIDERGCVFIFDLDYNGEEAYSPGDIVPFEEAFEPYEKALMSGEEIEPIVSNDTWGWVLTAYKPIKNSAGVTVAYAGADVSMNYLSAYARDFLLKALLIFSGFFVLILVFGLSLSLYYLVYPISSMTACAKDFIKSSGKQDAIEENAKQMKALEIHTGDEVEDLYTSVYKMEDDMAEQLRDIRHYADSTEKMQDGLIVTMADMVEKRDSDTGAHILKTAAYVDIILRALKRKGYYSDKLTDKYIADCIRSAPLHDVGKINIPDAVLNKPGKLTDEEFEIMKTHTTAGKNIMENAINTVQGENYLKEARNMAGYHHERWDGRGYPEKLKGEVIPLSARVMSVADVFDALTSARVYKPPFSMEKALSIIQEGAGTQFDPKCVEAFMDSLPEVKKVLKKYNQDMDL